MDRENVAEALRDVAASLERLAAALEPEAPKAVKGEERRRRFRDWVAGRAEPFGKRDAAEAMGVKTAPDDLLRWALGRGIIEELDGKAAAGRGGGGRPSRQFRYVPKVKERRPPKVKESAPASEPVRGTGKRARMIATDKRVRGLIDQLRADGFQATRAAGGHFKIYDSKSRLITTLPATPSDHRSIDNARALLRRKGANV